VTPALIVAGAVALAGLDAARPALAALRRDAAACRWLDVYPDHPRFGPLLGELGASSEGVLYLRARAGGIEVVRREGEALKFGW
jgi:hypothetical protein